MENGAAEGGLAREVGEVGGRGDARCQDQFVGEELALVSGGGGGRLLAFRGRCCGVLDKPGAVVVVLEGDSVDFGAKLNELVELEVLCKVAEVLVDHLAWNMLASLQMGKSLNS